MTLTGNRPSPFTQSWCATLLIMLALLTIFMLPRPAFARALPPAALAAGSGPYDAAGFGAEMRRLGAAIEKSSGNLNDIEAIQKALPASWQIDTSEAHYEFSSEPLREPAGVQSMRCSRAKIALRSSEILDGRDCSSAGGICGAWWLQRP